MDSTNVTIKCAIKSGDLEKIGSIITEHPKILRTPITENRGTPLHYTCQLAHGVHWLIKAKQSSEEHKGDEGDIVQFLIEKEKEMGAQLGGIPSYNMKDDHGDSPVFLTASEKIVWR